jgi:cell division control protein 24
MDLYEAMRNRTRSDAGRDSKANQYPKSAGPVAPAGFGQFPVPPKQIETTSLYAQTMSLISKLNSISDFEYYLFPDGVNAIFSGENAPVIDPIAILWHCFRLGAPLCHLFNQLEPKKLLPVPGNITLNMRCIRDGNLH